MCLGQAAQLGRRTKQCHFPQGLFALSVPDNGANMLAPCSFPLVAVGSHKGNHFKQNLDYILANTVTEGSLLSR